MKLETFFEKFDQFADAPDAVAKMRELVFDLAIRGRLVEPDPKMNRICISLLQRELRSLATKEQRRGKWLSRRT